MELFAITSAAFLASFLTFFSGFGLGTLLTPVFAIFFPIDLAVAMTAIVHFLNGLFKLGLVGRHAVMRIVLRFGIPAFLAAFLGAWVLVRVSDLPPLFVYSAFGRTLNVLPVKLVISGLMIIFACFELVPRLRDLEFSQRYLSLGGILSGFFGGLSGHQGALRSAFLARSGLTKEQFIGSGVAIAAMIDIVRLTVYSTHIVAERIVENVSLVTAATIAAFLGALLGNRFLKKVSMDAIQAIVSVTLFALAIAIAAGVI